MPLYSVPVCKGYDHCWIYDATPEDEPGVSLWSDISGIRSAADDLAGTCLIVIFFQA